MRIRAEGELMYVVDSNTKTKAYSIEMDIPDGLSAGEALGLVQNSRLTPLLKKKVENFNRWRTCAIVKLKGNVAPQPVEDTEEFEPEFEDNLEADEFSEEIEEEPVAAAPPTFTKVNKKKKKKKKKVRS